MTKADCKKKCSFLNREITRAYCMEIGDVRSDDMDIKHIEDRFDIES